MQRETLVLDKPEQLKALGHPLRVRVLEMLGQEGEWQLTNRELAQRLGVDPGHLHFHVRMLLRAGLIELADTDRRGREKPYRSVAKTFRVAPELLAAGGASDIQAAMLDQVQRAHALYSPGGTFRSAQVEVKLCLDVGPLDQFQYVGNNGIVAILASASIESALAESAPGSTRSSESAAASAPASTALTLLAGSSLCYCCTNECRKRKTCNTQPDQILHHLILLIGTPRDRSYCRFD